MKRGADSAPTDGAQGASKHSVEGASKNSVEGASKHGVALGFILAGAGAILGGLWLSSHGPLSVSDDDFARVVIAQRFAEGPRLDPSGTSWLPVPFYLDGLWLWLRDGSLNAAREAALLRSALASVLLFASARAFRLGLLAGLGVAWIPFFLPSVRVLTVATIPEFLTGALCIFAVCTLVQHSRFRDGPGPDQPDQPDSPSHPVPSPTLTVVALISLLAATLSRYEAWPVAALLGLYLGSRGRRFWPVAVGCLLGPAAWILHGAIHHHDPLFFATRVAAYRAALLGPASESLALTYPKSIFTLEPLLMALWVPSAALVLGDRRARRPFLRLWTLIAASVGLLALASLGNGAPTHHPERAIVMVWLAAPLALAQAAALLRFLPSRTRRIWALAGVAALGVGGYLMTQRPTPDYPSRASELEAGRALRAAQPEPETTVIATTDYGYFAIMAAAGHPARFVVAQDHDPRRDERNVSLAAKTRQALATNPGAWAVLPICFDFMAAEQQAERIVHTQTRDYQILAPLRHSKP